MERILEPEVMDDQAEALEYDRINHFSVNSVFVEDVIAQLREHSLAMPRWILDLGTGTARIPILLSRKLPDSRTIGVDLSGAMIHLAQRNVLDAGIKWNVDLCQASVDRLPLTSHSAELVISNSLLHHLPDPRKALSEVSRILGRGGVIFIRDLLRPPSERSLLSLVEAHTKGQSQTQRNLLEASLRAAFTLDEIRDLVSCVSFNAVIISATSDRHFTLVARG